MNNCVLFKEFQNRGYFHFQRSFLFFEADTSNTSRSVNVYVKIQPPENDDELQKHYIGNIYIYPDYDPETSTSLSHHDTLLYNNRYYVDEKRDH
jgi:hypothetical protein